MDPGQLAVNTYVFMRGGRNLCGEIESYEVMCGEIVKFIGRAELVVTPIAPVGRRVRIANRCSHP